MNLNWKRVGLDVLIIFVLTLIGGFIVGAILGSSGSLTSNSVILWTALSNIIFASAGFAYSAYKTTVNRWAHLVAVGGCVWALSLINVIMQYATIQDWLLSIIPIIVFIGIGGGIGTLLAKKKAPAAPAPFVMAHETTETTISTTTTTTTTTPTPPPAM